MLCQITTFVRHYKFTIASLVLAALVLGCAAFQPTTEHPTQPGKYVTRTQLDAAAKATAAEYEAAYADLDRQDDFIAAFTEVLAKIGEAIPSPYSGALMTALLMTTGGFGLDNRKKDRVIVAKDEKIDALANGHAPTA
jgi:hypothetical protein